MSSRRKNIIGLIFMLTGVALLPTLLYATNFWKIYVETVVGFMEQHLALAKFSFPFALSLATLGVVSPFLVIGALSGLLLRRLIRSGAPPDKTKSQIDKLGGIILTLERLKLESESTQQEVVNSQQELQELNRSIEKIKAVRDDEIRRVQLAVEEATRRPRIALIATHVAAFVLGLLASLAANLVTDYLKASGQWFVGH